MVWHQADWYLLHQSDWVNCVVGLCGHHGFHNRVNLTIRPYFCFVLGYMSYIDHFTLGPLFLTPWTVWHQADWYFLHQSDRVHCVVGLSHRYHRHKRVNLPILPYFCLELGYISYIDAFQD